MRKVITSIVYNRGISQVGTKGEKKKKKKNSEKENQRKPYCIKTTTSPTTKENIPITNEAKVISILP
jgi:hypothetical protein